MVMVMFATPVMFGWCFTVKVRDAPVPPMAAAMSAGKIRFGLSQVAVMRAPFVKHVIVEDWLLEQGR